MSNKDLATETGSIQRDIVSNRENMPDSSTAEDTRSSEGFKGSGVGEDLTESEERAHRDAISKARGQRDQVQEDKLPMDPVDPATDYTK